MSAPNRNDYFASHPRGSDDLDGTTATTPASLDLGCQASRTHNTLPDVPEELPDYGTMDNAPPEGHLRRAITNLTDRASRNGRYGSRTVTNSRATAQRPLLPARQQQQSEYPQRGYTEADYYTQNPWYGETQEKPVFSLGKPLPHVVRRRGQSKLNKRPAPKDEEQGISSGETLAEPQDRNNEGDVDNDLSSIPSGTPNRRSGRTQTQASDLPSLDGHRRPNVTAAGVAHGPKRNDAGQPVFDYQPGGAERTDRGMDRAETRKSSEPQRPARQSSHQPSFKIDGEPLGQPEHPAVEEGIVDPDEMRNWWARFRAKHPEPLAEFLATGVAIFMGLAGTLSVNLSANSQTKYGDYETSCWAWGFSWMLGIYLGGGVSGAHMNPAISISLSIFRGFPWRQCGIYVCAQFLASLAAGGLAYGCFADAIGHVDPELTDVSRSFFSTPQEWVTATSAFFNQVVGGAVMMIAVFALGDDQNNPPGAGMHAFVLGLLVTTLKFTLGYNVGSALNPASDFGPRVVAYAAGFQKGNVFGSQWWLYGPWLGTLVGSVLGCVIYDGCIFVGSESPINYRMTGSFKEKTRRYWSPFVGGTRKTMESEHVH